ncbi:putative PPC domain-containing protein [Medicago truncatula]|uniref:DUF296 domain protein n=1 Tax=Medicago truncatula TaxID=3880 RepID=G7K345_MEDTR|nr:AT-hook motif nuclear-localized protein 21 [Medicago truncatula]AET00217.1 DUF296 domain protein [Medicago truncatula]RHN57568.1 putative PPC domain-containing protein [Medicago truncatula]
MAAEKELAPFSQSSNTENEFSQNNYVRFSTSLLNTTTNIGTENLVMPKSPPGGAPSSGMLIDLPQNSREDLITTSSKRSRGRSKGSKNKPKPPVVITVEPESFMKQIFIEISAGCDVVESIIKMAWRHQADISVMRGSGLVSNITIRNSTSHSPALTIEGPIKMMSLSGTYINPNSDTVPSEFITNPNHSSFSIFLSGNGNEGQVYGGIVIGKIMASGNVMITATLQKKPKFYRVT